MQFALPGEWRKADLDDPAALAALTGLLPDEQQGSTPWLESIRAAGAQTLLLSIRATPPSAIVFIWPPEEADGDPSVEGLRRRLGLEGEVITHHDGYATLRQHQTAESSPVDVVTYALAHPDSGRVLVVRCMAFDGRFEEFKIEDFDLAASDLAWEEL
ncbi:hypothetical protein [Aeromicrobium sp. CF3.5]|uniref:hypothetical protein n=1 Tax=Aeromicrobium sp. CF3.5 TaxID=3373078 RepID=UPI003EE69E5A